MSKILYSGGSGTGKTTKLIEHYLELKTNSLVTNGFFILPTVEHAERIKTLVLQIKNPLFQDNITTFEQLVSNFIVERHISEIHKQHILKSLVQSESSGFFSRVRDFGIFYEQLSRLFAEFRNYDLTPAVLNKLTASPKNTALNKLYSLYLDHLADNSLNDQQGVLKIFLAKLNTGQITFNGFLLIDGFMDFTPLQQNILAALLKTAKFAATTVLYEDGRSELFREQSTNRNFFLDQGFTENILKENHRTLRQDIRHLLNNFKLEQPQEYSGTVENIALLSADNRLMELEQIAREILKLKNADTNLLWSDIALVFRKIGGYKHLIQDVFRRYNIPVTIHEGIYLHQNSFIQNLLTSPPAPLHFVERGDRAFSAVGEAKTYQELKEAIIEFVREHKLLDDLLNDSRYPELFAYTRESLKAYYKLLELLDTLNKISGPADHSILMKNLKDYLTQEMVSIKEKPANQVQVYDATISRQKQYRVVFIGNLTSGSFPAEIKEDIFLKDYEREQTGLKLSSEKIFHEAALFYQCLGIATDKLYFSLAYNEAKGQKVNPSHYLAEIKACFKDNFPPAQHRSYNDLTPQPEQCLSAEELKNTLLYNLYHNSSADIPRLVDSRKDLDFLRQVLEHKNDRVKVRAFHTAAKNELQKIKSISVTAAETFSRCRFAYFCQEVLKLREQVQDRYALDIGNVLHKCLQLYFFPLNKNKPDITVILQDNYPAEVLAKTLKLHPKQAEVEFERLKQILLAFTAEEEQRLKERHLTVKAVEQSFEYPFQQDIALTGKIDRLDTDGSSVLITDYKTGELPSPDPALLEKGILPQIILYALVYAEHYRQEVSGVEYRQVKKRKTKGLYLAERAQGLQVSGKNILERQAFAECFDKAKKLLLEHFADIQRGNFYDRNDKCSTYCAYSYICRLNKKDYLYAED